MKCSETNYANGLIILFCIFFLWTIYVLVILKKEEELFCEAKLDGEVSSEAHAKLIGIDKDTVKNIAKESIKMALDLKKHDFDI
jgi:low affinity Fe/Cu permease